MELTKLARFGGQELCGDLSTSCEVNYSCVQELLAASMNACWFVAVVS